MTALSENGFFLSASFIKDNATANKLLHNPLIQEDIWRTVEDLKLDLNQHDKINKISFELIEQDWLKLLAKFYILVRSERGISISCLKNSIASLNKFSLFTKKKSIFSCTQINDLLFDEFDYYLKSLNLSIDTISAHYASLSSFFNICREEGWFKVNTYWFKGRTNIRSVKTDETEYIPEKIWQQLDEHLHYLPESFQRMILVIRATGLRIGELLNLPLDCLRKRGQQWRLRFLTEKYKNIDELPICEELVAVVKEQQAYIKQHFGDSYSNLFNSTDGRIGYIPTPQVMNRQSFNNYLNKLAQQQNICTNEGKVWRFKSHQFRKTVATVMTNAGVRDLIIQKYLRHRSSNMQDYYKHLLKEVLGSEYQELMKGTSYVNSTGKLVRTHQHQNPITELVRRKMYQITTQYGECHRPILKSDCQTVNACWQCEHWLTSTNDLSALKDDLKRLEAELCIADNLGMVKQQQGLSKDCHNLAIRIEELEKVDERN